MAKNDNNGKWKSRQSNYAYTMNTVKIKIVSKK